MSGGDVEIPGILVQPESSSAHERRDETQQPGSPSVFISNPRAVDPSPTTGVIGGKAPVTEDSRVELSSSSSEEKSDFEDEVDYGDEPAPPDPSKFFHTSEEEMRGGEPSTASQLAIIPATGTLFTFCPDFPFHFEEKVLTFFIYTAGLAEDVEAATSSHIEETVQESTQPEGVEASVAEITSERATTEIGEISTLPEEEATPEVGKTPTPQDSPRGSTSLDLQPSKEALMS